MLPWKRDIIDLEQRLGVSLQDLNAALVDLQSKPVADPWQPDVRSLQANLGGLTERLATLETQLDLFPTFPPEIAGRIEALELKVKDQTHAISEGIERTARAERRIGQTIARARKELKSRGFTDPGLEAEDRELRLVDGGGSEPAGLQPVPRDVDAPGAEASSVKGVTVAELSRARGL